MADTIVGSAPVAGQSCVFYVYLISRPDGTPCYVGKGKGRRLNAHFNKPRNKHLAAIIALNGGRLPVRKIADEMPENEAYELEHFLIVEIGRKCDGGPLVNHSHGGLGGSAGRKQSDEERAMRREAMAKPETRERMRLSHAGKPSGRKGQKASPESIERLRLSHLGVPQSQETIDKRTAKLRGQKRTAEYCASVSINRTGEKRSPEACKRMSLGQIGKKYSDETNKKRAESTKIALQRPEVRAKLSAATTAQWADPVMREKMLLANNSKGNDKPRSLETRTKISKARSGVSLSEEHKKSLSYSLKRYWRKRREV